MNFVTEKSELLLFICYIVHQLRSYPYTVTLLHQNRVMSGSSLSSMVFTTRFLNLYIILVTCRKPYPCPTLKYFRHIIYTMHKYLYLFKT